jgi:hypothetical protein
MVATTRDGDVKVSLPDFRDEQSRGYSDCQLAMQYCIR